MLIFFKKNEFKQFKKSKLSIFIIKALGNPHEHLKVIHVTGTNGKGTVSLKLAKCLEYSDYKIGLFTSPHLFSFRERF